MLLVVKMSSADGGRDVRDVASSIRRHLNDKNENRIYSQVLFVGPLVPLLQAGETTTRAKKFKMGVGGVNPVFRMRKCLLSVYIFVAVTIYANCTSDSTEDFEKHYGRNCRSYGRSLHLASSGWYNCSRPFCFVF